MENVSIVTLAFVKASIIVAIGYTIYAMRSLSWQGSIAGWSFILFKFLFIFLLGLVTLGYALFKFSMLYRSEMELVLIAIFSIFIPLSIYLRKAHLQKLERKRKYELQLKKAITAIDYIDDHFLSYSSTIEACTTLINGWVHDRLKIAEGLIFNEWQIDRVMMVNEKQDYFEGGIIVKGSRIVYYQPLRGYRINNKWLLFLRLIESHMENRFISPKVSIHELSIMLHGISKKNLHVQFEQEMTREEFRKSQLRTNQDFTADEELEMWGELFLSNWTEKLSEKDLLKRKAYIKGQSQNKVEWNKHALRHKEEVRRFLKEVEEYRLSKK